MLEVNDEELLKRIWRRNEDGLIGRQADQDWKPSP